MLYSENNEVSNRIKNLHYFWRMEYLFLSILISSSLFVVFKLFEVYKISILQAIIVNYIVAFTIGYNMSSIEVRFSEIPRQPWFLSSLLLGFIFIFVFNIMGLTAQKNGLSVASVAGKMSVIIPVIFGVITYNESLGVVKVIGIILALIAVYLTSMKKNITTQRSYLIYPVMLFLGSGIIDASIKYVETMYVQKGGVPLFSAITFLSAFFFGSVFLLVKSYKESIKFSWKNIVGGFALGIPNYFSMDFLLRALKTEGLESSTIFTINNVSVVLLTTILGLLLFGEKLLVKNWVGIGMAVVSIILVAVV